MGKKELLKIQKTLQKNGESTQKCSIEEEHNIYL